MARSQKQLEKELNQVVAEMAEQQKAVDRWRQLEREQDEMGDKTAAQIVRAREMRASKKEKLKELRDEGAKPARLENLADAIEDLTFDIKMMLVELDMHKNKGAIAKEVLEKARSELEQEKERRQKVKEEMDAGKGPSPHFAFSEFDCKNGTPVPKVCHKAIAEWCAKVGEPLRAKFGAVRVNSGYRTPTYNSDVGGETNSVHLYSDHPSSTSEEHMAVAVDIRCERGTAREWYEFTAGKADGRGLYSTFHHSDLRSKIDWPGVTWTG